MGGALPLLKESMKISMLARRASIQGAILPVMSTRNTISATPFVLTFCGGAGVATLGSSKLELVAWPAAGSDGALPVEAISPSVGFKLEGLSERSVGDI
jgi:hypothetical protein